ncbi:hypothetical protein BCR42DRAFT_407859, partial [Absidia repens]
MNMQIHSIAIDITTTIILCNCVVVGFGAAAVDDATVSIVSQHNNLIHILQSNSILAMAISTVSV